MPPSSIPVPLVPLGHLSGSLRQLMVKRLLRSLWRAKLRVFVVLILILTASSLSLTLAEFNRNAEAVYEDFYLETNLADLMVETGDWPVPRENLSLACVDLMARSASPALPVTTCESRLVLDGQYLKDERNDQWIRATLYGFETPTGEVSRLWFDPDHGRMALAADEAVIDLHVHTELGVDLGDRITVRVSGRMADLTVVGIASSPHHLFYIGDPQTLLPEEGSYAVLYLPVEHVAALGELDPNARNQLLVDVRGTPAYDLQDTTTDEGAALRPLKLELAAALGARNVSNFQVLDRGGIYSVELLRQDLAGSQKTLPVITGLLIGISGLVIAISLDRLIRSQSREIGVLRALGLSGAEIRNVYLLAPVLLGTVGTTIGILLGLWCSARMSRWYFDYWGVPVVVVRHYWDLVLFIWFLVVGLVLLFGLRPALKAARLMPLEVIGTKPGSRPWEGLLRLTAGLPVTVGLGLRSTLRKPARLAMTVVGLGLALMIVGGTALMMSSMMDTLRGGLDEAEAWDAQVSFMPEQETELRNWSEAHPEVEVQWLLQVEGNASGDERRLTVFGLERFSNTDRWGALHVSRLSQGRLPDPDRTPTEALVDEGTFKLLEWEVGEVVELNIAGNQVRVRLVGVSDELSRSLWLWREDLWTILEDESVNGVYLKGLEPGTPAARELEQLVYVTYHDDLVEGFDKAWESQSAAMGLFLAVGGIIGIVVLLNTLLINLAERDAELATLRVLGASRRSLTGILLVEHAVVGLLGGLGGAVASLFTAAWFTSSFTTWSFYFAITIDWLILVYIVLFILAASLLTTFIGIWRIGRMDLVAKVKEWGS